MVPRKRRAKAMAPQNTETVELPDIIEPVQENDGWMFPKNWTDEDKRDWLVTHPTGVESIPDPDVPHDDGTVDSGPDAETSELASEEDVINALKADGMHYAAMALPMELKDTVNSENYDPREFFLVHSEVWNEMVSATVAEAELGLENKELRKRVNALTRGMRKVNKHWSATKRELKRALQGRDAAHADYVKSYKDMYDTYEEREKRQNIFATRLARRLRKARAGRDKRERQLQQANMTIAAQDQIMARQDEYISHLERLLGGKL